MKIWITCLCISILCAPAAAQVIQLQGGTSSIFDASGASGTLYLPQNTVQIGGGVVNGAVGYSLSDTFKVGTFECTAGTHNFFGAVDSLGGVFFQETGVFVQRAGIGVFIGATGTGYTSPFFQTSKAQHIGVGLSYRKKWAHWQATSVQALSGGQHTLAGSLMYIGTQLQLTAAGGLLANKPTVTATAVYKPVRELQLIGMHENMFWGTQTATVNSAGAFAGLGRFSVSASAFNSVSANKTMNGTNFGIGVHVKAVNVSMSGYRSAGHLLYVGAVTETSRHWSLTQTVGKGNFGAGGGYHNNRFSVSANQGVGFSPTNGFVKTESLTLTVHIHDSTVTGAINQAMGQTRFSAYGSTFGKGPINIASTGGVRHTYQQHGKYVMNGTVKDGNGNAISGAAILLDKTEVFSTDDGTFIYHTGKRSVTIQVLPEDFTAPGRWRVTSAPSKVTPEQVVDVVVTRAP